MISGNLIAQYETQDGVVEVHGIDGRFTVFQGERMLQKDLGNREIVCYLAHVLQSMNYKLSKASPGEALHEDLALAKAAIKTMAEDGWMFHGPEGMSESQELCYQAYLKLGLENACFVYAKPGFKVCDSCAGAGVVPSPTDTLEGVAPQPRYIEHITFEGRDCVVLSPEEYEALWEIALRAAPPTTESEKVADLKRQLAGERDHGKRLQQQLDAILRTDSSPQSGDEER